MTERLWVLGAADPEMSAIETLLRNAGETVAYATVRGVRVHPGNAYAAAAVSGDCLPTTNTKLVLVECDGQGIRQHTTAGGIVVVDHHRPGDPGYGKPPQEFLAASSIGQVISLLARLPGFRDFGEGLLVPAGMGDSGGAGPYMGKFPPAGEFTRNSMGSYAVSRGEDAAYVPATIVMVAAADHCLAHAYAGKCPGVDPEALMRWRAESRAAFQRRPVEAVLADVEAARKRLHAAVQHTADIESTPRYTDGTPINAEYADLRGESIPELPEAAVREGVAFLASTKDRDGREKVVLQAASPELVARFLAGAIVPGLVDTYGDPARGFAGGYLKGGA